MLQETPDDPAAHYQLGLIYARTGVTDSALQHLLRYAELKPEDKDAWNSLGYLFYETGRYKEAELHLNHALLIDPDYGLAHYNKALIYYQTGRYQQAVVSHEKATQNGYPGCAQFADRLQRHPHNPSTREDN